MSFPAIDLMPLKVLAVLAVTLLAGTGLPVHAQTGSADSEIESADATKEISVEPGARDTEIAERLTRILEASNWFSDLAVSVREGIVFLDGSTETDERKDWARQLALRTQDVVAVVNRIEVQPTISWDLTPTWRELERLADRAQWFAPLFVVSVVILFITWFLARGVAALARRALRRRLPSLLLVNLVARALTIPVILIGIYLVLQLAGLTRLAVTVLGGTGLIGIVLGLAFREIAENALASILLSIRNPFRVDDSIQVGEYKGIVQNLNMRTTVLLTLDGNHVQIPNSLVFKSVVTNFSSNPGQRAEFSVGIGYPDSIVEAQDVIIAALHAHPAVLDDPEPVALVDELGPSTVDLKVQFWFDGRSYSVFKLRSSLMRQVKRALQDAGISMPDAAREVVFPDGVPIHRVDVEPHPEEEKARPAPQREEDESATISAGEGSLEPEEADLIRRTSASDIPEARDNLLSRHEDQRNTS